ncbi:hypothetical protein LG651_13750 [Tamlana sp. 62-3]|uniref:Uncharacterized protein n=1 Tax=Neotamlana sargassicola TaxID=2883125 RepID=A0A9X1L7X2_9FLAO|nr:hypothetical protein [Tamlana sargassicola]MCB4809316.1 hypothetical protein [Tamlana sargassicola]
MSKIFIPILTICFCLFAICEFLGYYILSTFFDSIMVPLITVCYLVLAKEKNIWFFLFLIFYSISDVLGFIVEWTVVDFNLDGSVYYKLDYYVSNILYDLAYLCLIVKISKFLSMSFVLKNLWIHIIVLAFLNIYLIYVLQLVSDTSLRYEFESIFEVIYNSIVLLLLSISLLNYFYNDNKKSLYLFLGSLSIVFSEVMDVAYIYVSSMSLIYVLGSTFTLLAFYFFYLQSGFVNGANRFKILNR